MIHGPHGYIAEWLGWYLYPAVSQVKLAVDIVVQCISLHITCNQLHGFMHGFVCSRTNPTGPTLNTYSVVHFYDYKELRRELAELAEFGSVRSHPQPMNSSTRTD